MIILYTILIIYYIVEIRKCQASGSLLCGFAFTITCRQWFRKASRYWIVATQGLCCDQVESSSQRVSVYTTNDANALCFTSRRINAMRYFRWPPSLFVLACACALPCLAMELVEGKLIELSSCSILFQRKNRVSCFLSISIRTFCFRLVCFIYLK